MTTNPGSLADISFRLLQPKLMDPPLILSEPERALEDIPFDEVIMLMTVYFHLQDYAGEDTEDLVRRFDVRPETMAPFVESRLRNRSWWHGLVSRARENQTEEQARQEGRDWATIGNMVMSFYQLQAHTEAYPLSIPEMLVFYAALVSHQRDCRDSGDEPVAEAVDEKDLDMVWVQIEAFERAVHRRVQTFEAIPDDTQTSAPLFPLFGDVATYTAWAMDQHRARKDEEHDG